MLKNIISEQKGFTLIELALVLLITSISMLAVAQFMRIYTMTVKREKTIANLEMIYNALEEYSALTGVYPCPANPAAAPGDSDYGDSKCRNILDATFDPDSCTAVPTGISCTTIGTRDADLNGSNDVVMTGVIPINTILEGISDTPIRGFHKTDGYGALIGYAVTERLTETFPANNLVTPFNPLMGAIDVRDENLVSHMEPPSEAQFVIFSFGANNVGGHSQNGQLIKNCFVPSFTGGPPDTTPVPGLYSGNGKLDTENCDNNDGIFIKGLLSMGDNDAYYDDYLYYKGRGISSLWKNSISSPPGQSYIYNTNLGNVGVGTSQPTSKLHVIGDISAERSLIAPAYCDPGKFPSCDMDADPTCGGECLNPRFLAADIGSDARCAADEVAYAVGRNKIVCRKPDWTIPAKTCQDIGGYPSYMQGFSNLGNIYCCLADGATCEKQCDTDPCPCNQVECTCSGGSCQCVEGTCP